ncbi:MAG TPA: GH92 family glycosyl hydrolase [Candidatus Saccharimonadales bacterium]|nr:GH92 family glycosyl hydrolase [Candidatus Saccharimonadales bacterium]
MAALSALPVGGLLDSSAMLGRIPEALGVSGPAESREEVSRYVKLSIGTGGHGHTYPGATVPFGMVQLSPDTYNDGWDWCSGYHYSDSSIMGFSHTHLSGTGASDMLDFLLMPGTGPAKTVPGSRQNPGEGYRSRFSHEEERAEPGYYAVTLRDYGIQAELSATERAGIHRYTFPKSESSHFVLDLVHVYGNADIVWADLKITGQDTITGGRSVKGWAPGREIYFAMKFSKPFESFEIIADKKRLEPGAREVKGRSLKCLTHFKTTDGEQILVKVGISGVSAEGAQNNLQAEIPDWDFARVRSAARARWNEHLSKIKITTASERHKRIFYTALYHTMVAPTLFDDRDGHYRGMDGQVRQVPPGMHNYSTFSLWDTFRAAHPLYTLCHAERVPDFVNCLIRMGQESPGGAPVWPLQAKETFCMTGYHSSSVVAEALVKGFPGIGVSAAYEVFKKRAMSDEYGGLAYYRKLGYIPCDREAESVSKTMEYAYNDWAVAQIAKAAGAVDDWKVLSDRARNYKNLFDKKTGFIRPRLENGQWAEPFDATEMGHAKRWKDYTESDPWQTTFTVQHDPAGLIELFGGHQAFVEKLDTLFTTSSALPADAPPDIAGMVGQYAHGNEPCHHMAYLYCYAGAAHKTQDRVRKLLELEYDDQPDGLAGNEDCGQMSAWYVMSAIGFYAVDPVGGNYVFGTPLFDRAEVELGRGKKLVLEARRSSPADQYIQSLTLNGKAYSKLWFRHEDIANGGHIEFRMGQEPGPAFEKDPPPSLGALPAS